MRFFLEFTMKPGHLGERDLNGRRRVKICLGFTGCEDVD